MEKKLTLKQERFVQEYLIDLNATRAAIRAGYSENTAGEIGYENLKKPQIKEALQGAMDDRAKKLELSQEWVLQRLKNISDRCVQAEPVMVYDREAKEMVETGEYRFDSAGANKATELIGKHLGMFKEEQNNVQQVVHNQVNHDRVNEARKKLDKLPPDKRKQLLSLLQEAKRAED